MPSRNGSMYVARVQDLEQNLLDCHTYGHAWDPGEPVEAYDARADEVVLIQQVGCLRCPKVRTDRLDRNTHVKVGRSTYSEVERYRVLEKTHGRTTYRREAIRRQLAAQRARGPQRFKVS